MKMLFGEIDDKLFAPCGMNCMVCYKHCQSKKACGGCGSDQAGKPEHCRRCKIKNCSVQKGASHCYECAEFPCKLIKTLDKSYKSRYNSSLVENGRLAKEIGAAAFLKGQKEKYTCPACGGVISLHDAQCSECRSPVK